MTPLFTKSFVAAAETGGYLIAKLGASGAQAATASTDAIIGVTDAMGAGAGQPLDVHQLGWAEVRLGGTVAAGAPLTASADGRAITATAAAGVRIVGFAMLGGVEDDIVPAQLSPGFMG